MAGEAEKNPDRPKINKPRHRSRQIPWRRVHKPALPVSNSAPLAAVRHGHSRKHPSASIRQPGTSGSGFRRHLRYEDLAVIKVSIIHHHHYQEGRDSSSTGDGHGLHPGEPRPESCLRRPMGGRYFSCGDLSRLFCHSVAAYHPEGNVLLA